MKAILAAPHPNPVFARHRPVSAPSVPAKVSNKGLRRRLSRSLGSCAGRARSAERYVLECRLVRFEAMLSILSSPRDDFSRDHFANRDGDFDLPTPLLTNRRLPGAVFWKNSFPRGRTDERRGNPLAFHRSPPSVGDVCSYAYEWETSTPRCHSDAQHHRIAIQMPTPPQLPERR